MKSYNHLYEKMIDEDNIRTAIHDATKGKKKVKTIPVSEVTDQQVAYYIKYAEQYVCFPHKKVQIYDGISRKKRTIIVPNNDEQVLHHMMMNVLAPIFQRQFIYHSYGSIPGKGVHRGKKAVEKWIKNDTRHCKYVCQLDIHHYFESVSIDVLSNKLRSLIHDERFLAIVLETLKATDSGIPLGFYTSQWFSNWYLTAFDHYVTEVLKPAHYIRLMDDMVIFGANKRRLRRQMEAIREYLRNELGLELKGNWQIFQLSEKRPLDFMGFQFYPSRTVLRDSIFLKSKRKTKRVAKKEKPTIRDLRQLMSYTGWYSNTDSYGAYKGYIKPYFDLRKARKRMSRYDKRRNEKCGENLKV